MYFKNFRSFFCLKLNETSLFLYILMLLNAQISFAEKPLTKINSLDKKKTMYIRMKEGGL